MTKIEKMRKQLNENFRSLLNEAFRVQFNDLELITEWDFASMNLVSYLANGEDLNEEQDLWIQTYSLGYVAAMQQIDIE